MGGSFAVDPEVRTAMVSITTAAQPALGTLDHAAPDVRGGIEAFMPHRAAEATAG
ncbi:hypothetical protein ACWEV3_23515 [Saccharopolyspora sp. NPDC003752]